MTAQTADVIVIGGGVAGLSTAMQLAIHGAKVLVVERQRIGNGSTGRAAGLLGQLRGTAEATRMLMDGVEIVRELERCADVEIFVQTGSLRIAETPERAREIVDLVEMGRAIGFEIDHIPIGEVSEKLPYMRTDDLLDACYCRTDGHLQPAELVSAYIRIGKSHGVEYKANCPVEGMMIEGGKVKGVKTPDGPLYAPTIVNAGGPWSYLLAELAETVLPTAAVGHYYLTTRPDDSRRIDRFSPAVRDRHLRLYTRAESGGLIVGMYGEETVEYDMEKLPVDFDMSAMKTRLDDIHVATLIYVAGQRFSWINERTPMTITSGIMTFTPDGKPFCGKMPDIEGLYYCSGFCGHGIVQSPAIGVIMADLIRNGQTDYDIAAIEADRYFDSPDFQERAEIKASCYQMHGGYYGRVEGKKQ
ncbi:MAG: FAD-binding oxidoreductase [Pirellulaceae bacterium]|nr:FAD-binding oxidoreductase [Pirellulaceae bacterium]MDP7304726.1 FAD-binding oxidoreductase [Pirellulaceae bacterium]HJN13023.1 FAD-binding oxidoreductase [Pirellulaceae bacterium]